MWCQKKCNFSDWPFYWRWHSDTKNMQGRNSTSEFSQDTKQRTELPSPFTCCMKCNTAAYLPVFESQQQSPNSPHFTLILEEGGKSHLTKVLMLFSYKPIPSHSSRFKNTFCPELAISGWFPQGDLCCCNILC